MPPRTCLTCGALTDRGGTSRCARCRATRQRARDARRGTPNQRGYTAAYRRARAQLLANEPRCHWCPAPATQADHYPPLGTGLPTITLLPSCAACNASHRAQEHWDSHQG